jgi:methionyl aminopeptidase
MSKGEYIIHSPQEIAGIRRAAAASAMVRDALPAAVIPGMTTKQLDDLAGRLIAGTGGVSAFHGYRGFPGQICISLNDEVVHGIGHPERIMREGDLVSMDVGVRVDGCIGDTATSFVIGGRRDPDTERLLTGTAEALTVGIRACRAGNRVRDISAAVEEAAREYRLSVVREYVGHGVGTELHEPPEIPNYVVRNRGPELHPGMILAIEPMLNLGTHRVAVSRDGWTVRTADGRLSAHFEHMVLVTNADPEILTWPKTK